MLQGLYGYTATDAGLVLGPGAMVIVVLAPVIVKILPKVGVKPLIFTGYVIFCIAMWSYSRIDLGTDYKHIALLRALQGLGIAAALCARQPARLFLFAEAQKQQSLQPHQSLSQSRRAASALLSSPPFSRARTQYHQSVLVAHATPVRFAISRHARFVVHYFLPRAATSVRLTPRSTPRHNSPALSSNKRPSSALMDCFWLLSCACLLGAQSPSSPAILTSPQAPLPPTKRPFHLPRYSSSGGAAFRDGPSSASPRENTSVSYWKKFLHIHAASLTKQPGMHSP